MTDKITVYEKPTCSTCREVNKILKENDIDFDKVNYYVEPLSKSKIKELLKKMGIGARELLRTKETIYRELGIAKEQLGEDEIVDLMVKHPDLMQRPIVERGNKAVLGRPAEAIRTFLMG
ncbi:MAG: arsenate reductase family protein [Candidatus Obscuribacterales bacterium]|nr:arsenate reductase family protein [Candidatus Obscuribacterales bacterium]